MVSAVYQYESSIGIPMPTCSPSHLPPPATPLGCHRAPALGSLHHAANSQNTLRLLCFIWAHYFIPPVHLPE